MLLSSMNLHLCDGLSAQVLASCPKAHADAFGAGSAADRASHHTREP